MNIIDIKSRDKVRSREETELQVHSLRKFHYFEVKNIYYRSLFYTVDFEISLRQSVSFWQVSNQLLCLSHFISRSSLGPLVLQFTEGHSLWYGIQGLSFQPFLFSFSPFYYTFLDYISDSNTLDWITHFFWLSSI